MVIHLIKQLKFKKMDLNYAKKRLLEINENNKSKKEHSLGDVLLIDKFEAILRRHGLSQDEIKLFSPLYYKDGNK